MTLEVTDIMEILPHRYPMLLVDRIIELEPVRYASGIKNATVDEQLFQGQFPGQLHRILLIPGLVRNMGEGAVEVDHWGLDTDLVIDVAGNPVGPAGNNADDVAGICRGPQGLDRRRCQGGLVI